MRILVTGAGGFIAGYLIPELLASGHDVIGLDNDSKYGPVRRSFDTHPSYRAVHGDADLEPAEQPPLALEFLYVSEQLKMGLTVDTAFREMGQRTGLLEMKIFTLAVVVHRQTGDFEVTPVQR